MPWRTILVPYDFSASAERALAIAVAEAKRQGGRILLLHVVELMPHFGPETTLVMPEGGGTPIGPHQYARSRAQAELAEVAARIGGDVEAIVGEGVPYEEIERVARERHADLIVMGTNGRTGLRHLLVGSVTERVVRTSSVPVLTTRG